MRTPHMLQGFVYRCISLGDIYELNDIENLSKIDFNGIYDVYN